MIALIVCIVGGLVYITLNSTSGEEGRIIRSSLAELGKHAFWVGLLAYLLVK